MPPIKPREAAIADFQEAYRTAWDDGYVSDSDVRTLRTKIADLPQEMRASTERFVFEQYVRTTFVYEAMDRFRPEPAVPEIANQLIHDLNRRVDALRAAGRVPASDPKLYADLEFDAHVLSVLPAVLDRGVVTHSYIDEQLTDDLIAQTNILVAKLSAPPASKDVESWFQSPPVVGSLVDPSILDLWRGVNDDLQNYEFTLMLDRSISK